MKTLCHLSILLLAVFLSNHSHADIYFFDVDVDSQEVGTYVDVNFNLKKIASIDSVTIELSHTWGGDLDIVLTAPDNSQYSLMLDETAGPNAGNFDLGQTANNGSLANVAPYTFVPSSALNWVGPLSTTGTYNSNSWASGPHEAGSWNFTIVDDALGDVGSVGQVAVEYTAFIVVPEPTIGGLLLFGCGLFLARRRKRTG